METESTSNRLLIKELWKIIADYGDIGIGAIEKNLLQQLKTYSEELADSSDESHNLARELLTIIASRKPCTASVIRKAVKGFLAGNAERITNGKFKWILEAILNKTLSQELPVAPITGSLPAFWSVKPEGKSGADMKPIPTAPVPPVVEDQTATNPSKPT